MSTSPRSAFAESRPIALAAIMVVVSALAALSLAGPSTADADGDVEIVSFDVAENGSRFVFDAEPRVDGLPAYGNDFVTEGYLFAPGTLGASDGVEADGSLADGFEDLVIGEWKCFGYFVGDGATTAEGEWVVTTQIYRFYGDDGRDEADDRIVSIGTENVAGSPAAIRALTGGTGRYRTARGEVVQLTLGHNASEGVNASVWVALVDED